MAKSVVPKSPSQTALEKANPNALARAAAFEGTGGGGGGGESTPLTVKGTSVWDQAPSGEVLDNGAPVQVDDLDVDNDGVLDVVFSAVNAIGAFDGIIGNVYSGKVYKSGSEYDAVFTVTQYGLASNGGEAYLEIYTDDNVFSEIDATYTAVVTVGASDYSLTWSAWN